VRGGEVVDVDAVSAALKQLWSQAKFGSKKVVVGVANQKVVVRQVDLPWMPVDELRASLAFQVQDYIPMPVEQAILDFHPLEEFASENGSRMLRVLLVAAARDMVDSAVVAVQSAGLEPVMVDLTSFAVLRSLYRPSAMGALEAEALVDVGASVTNIVVHQGGVPRFVRILLMGGADITDAVAERLGVPADQAESVKQTTGLAGVAGMAEAHPANRAIEQTGGAFVEEVRSSLDYYAAQPGASRVGKVVLSGGGSRLGGLVERLSTATRLPVEVAHPMASLRLGKTGLTDDQLAYVEPMVTVPVGLAMGVAS
ncbi:MAG TPA: type IV pilus assembly protein PilM, partial [Mycobacteriales bacterium]|nr:type IV pilus assembly protein PilM [Mycobacteriales bacterium]